MRRVLLMSGLVIFDAETLAEVVANLRATLAKQPEPARQRPKPDEQIEYETRCEELAADRKAEREAGVSGAESDRRADLEWDERTR